MKADLSAETWISILKLSPFIWKTDLSKIQSMNVPHNQYYFIVIFLQNASDHWSDIR